MTTQVTLLLLYAGAHLLLSYLLYNFPSRGFSMTLANPFLDWLGVYAPKPAPRSVASDDTLNDWILAGTGETLAEFVEADPHKLRWAHANLTADINQSILDAMDASSSRAR
jgi:hypothetical protein